MGASKPYEGEEYEMLNHAARGTADDSGDGDVVAMRAIKYGQESYQSTARILVWVLCVLTGLLLILTSTTIGSAIASNRKSLLNIQGIMPSVNIAIGDCDSLKFPNLVLILFINLVGTVIIGVSNYLQQSSMFKNLTNESLYKPYVRGYQKGNERLR
jgi:hypothetical protein